MNPNRALVSVLAIAIAFVAVLCVNVFGPKLVPSLADDPGMLRMCRYAAALIGVVSVKIAFGAYRPVRA